MEKTREEKARGCRDGEKRGWADGGGGRGGGRAERKVGIRTTT